MSAVFSSVFGSFSGQKSFHTTWAQSCLSDSLWLCAVVVWGQVWANTNDVYRARSYGWAMHALCAWFCMPPRGSKNTWSPLSPYFAAILVMH